MKIDAAVIWYNPSGAEAANLLSYVEFVDKVLVIDNSDGDNGALVPAHPKVQYRPQFGNQGLGRALNRAFAEARSGGAEWVLAMDQDSAFTPADCAALMDAVRELGADPAVAIVAPTFSDAGRSARRDECDSVITSGSVIRISAHADIGGHNEGLFVDDVDHEFGYRLRRRGLRIVRVHSVWLRHRVGVPFARKVLWRTVHTTNHSAIRKYYMTRNRLYMRKNFPEFGAPYLRMVLMDALKVVLVEDQKLPKLRLMMKGAIDFHRGVLGELR